MFLLRAQTPSLMEGQLNTTDCSCPALSQLEIWSNYLLEGVSIPLVGSVGLLGNLAAIVVLSHPDMKSTFNQSLITLAIFEITFLVLLISDHAVDITTELYIMMFPYLLYPLKNIMVSCESYLLVSIAMERLMAVVRPLWYRTAQLRRDIQPSHWSSSYNAALSLVEILVLLRRSLMP